jgi:hypothetical protein
LWTDQLAAQPERIDDHFVCETMVFSSFLQSPLQNYLYRGIKKVLATEFVVTLFALRHGSTVTITPQPAGTALPL